VGLWGGLCGQAGNLFWGVCGLPIGLGELANAHIA